MQPRFWRQQRAATRFSNFTDAALVVVLEWMFFLLFCLVVGGLLLITSKEK